ncbi:hypothetical protein BC937DRAFT_88636 [Endogone sp. FLAS-F59071]|nr:hypothetical protein BC937DRAFT_88636 [Endogone sp. FLAS-F59071]|eukprot:RUS18550.1 hypothetical protein BC937DRAFT_88636 [Endogone sp. FLAS-F59071]
MARKMRPALCVTYTMSDTSAKPSSLSCEMYACSSTLILLVDSSIPSLTGTGTRSSSLLSSSFSSSRTGMYLNSSDSANSRNSSMWLIMGRRC